MQNAELKKFESWLRISAFFILPSAFRRSEYSDLESYHTYGLRSQAKGVKGAAK